MTLKRIAAAAILALFPLAAQATVPPVPDTDRYASFTLSTPTSVVGVPFAVYGDCSDLQIYYNSAPLPYGAGWSCASASGVALSLQSLPITDVQITLSPARSSGTLEIIGGWHARHLFVPTSPGITRNEFEQANGTFTTALRELQRSAPTPPTVAGYVWTSQGPGVPGAWVLPEGVLASTITNAQATAILAAAPLTPTTYGNTSTCISASDDTAAVQAAMADPRPLYIPAGYNCKIASAATFTGGSKRIYGDGLSSIITITNATTDGLVLNSSGQIILRDLMITTSVPKTAGDAVKITCTTSCPGIGSKVDHVYFQGGTTNYLYSGLHVVSGVIPTIHSSYFLNQKFAGLWLEDTTSAGAGGETSLVDTTFDSALTAIQTGGGSAAILVQSGAGTVTLTGGRIQHFDWGLLYSLTASPGTQVGALVVNGTSFESQNTNAAVGLSAAGSAGIQSATFNGVRVLANNTGKCIINATGSNWVGLTTISGGTYEFTTDYCLNIQGGYNLNISGATLSDTTQTGKTAILLGASYPAGQVFIGPNQFTPGTTPIYTNGNPRVVWGRLPNDVSTVIPTTGTTIAFPDFTRVYQLAPAGTLAALAVGFPSFPGDGQIITLATTQAITALTTNPGGGQTINNGYAAATLAAGAAASWQYHAAGATWYRVQ
jgi:hypothetical protein